MNSFCFTLSGKHFICPSILNDSFAGQSNLGCRSLLFITLNISCQSLLACKVSFQKSADSLMGTPLQAIVCFSFAAFKKYIFIDYAITVVPFPPLHSTPSCTPPPSHSPPHSSCPWVILISSLASHFLHYSCPPPVYFPPIIYATYSLYLSLLSPLPMPLLITLHVISISVVLFLFQLFAQFAFVFVLSVVVNNYEFAVIFTVIFFIFFFLDKSL